MAVAQQDIAEVKTIQVLDGRNYNQHMQMEPYMKYIKGDSIHSQLYQVILDTHLEFLRAGANVIRTNTFGAAFPQLQQHKGDINLTDYHKIIGISVQAAKQAIKTYVKEVRVSSANYWILGSCGSATDSGYLPVPFSLRKCKIFHEERIKAFIANNIHCLAFESIETVSEALLLTKLLREFPSVRAYMSFRPNMGCNLKDYTHIQKAIHICYQQSKSQIFAFGVNCVVPEDIQHVLTQINELCNPIPHLVVCPANISATHRSKKFRPSMCRGEQHYFLDNPNTWDSLNVRYIGGCCGTLPEHIREIRDSINKINESGSQLPQI